MKLFRELSVKKTSDFLLKVNLKRKIIYIKIGLKAFLIKTNYYLNKSIFKEYVRYNQD